SLFARALGWVRFMESIHSLLPVHWDPEPPMEERAPPRCCRHLAGSSFLRLVCRQAAGSTVRFMEASSALRSYIGPVHPLLSPPRRGPQRTRTNAYSPRGVG